MKVIQKYKLRQVCRQSIDMPVGADILNLQIQNSEVTIWVAVPKNAKLEIKTFKTFSTGENIDDYDKLKYVGTYQMPTLSVWHVFVDKI